MMDFSLLIGKVVCMFEDVWAMVVLEWIEFHIGASRKGKKERKMHIPITIHSPNKKPEALDVRKPKAPFQNYFCYVYILGN